MANLAEKHDEENSAQLADAEISRILSVLQKLNSSVLRVVTNVPIKPSSRAH